MLVVITKGELTKIGLSKLRETTGDLGGTCVHLLLRVLCACVRCAHLFLRLYTFYLALVNMVRFCAFVLVLVYLCACVHLSDKTKNLATGDIATVIKPFV